MAGKPARPKARKSAKPKGGRGEARVLTTIHVSRDTFEMLSDAALAREIVNVARASHGQKVKMRDRNQCVAGVIEELIERHRTELEAEGELIRSGRTRRKAAAKKPSPRPQKTRQGTPQSP